MATNDAAATVAPAAARLVARDEGLGYCGTFYSYCPMFVAAGRVFFRGQSASSASIRSASTSDRGGTTTLIAATDDGANLFGPFLGGDGIEWLVQDDDGSSTTLFTGSGADATSHTLGIVTGATLVATDDASAIYLFVTHGTLVRVSKSDGTASTVGALDGFVPIAAVADSDPEGFLYATGLGGIARLAKMNALATTLSSDPAGGQFGDRLSVGVDLLFAAEESASTSAIVARPLTGGDARTVASAEGGSSSIVVDGDRVYWIAVSGEESDLSSALWSSPLSGGGAAATKVYGETGASWLTGVAFDEGVTFVTTSDGRLMALRE